MDNFSYYTVQELKRYARQNNIHIGGLTRKADIINAIKNVGISLTPVIPKSTDRSNVPVGLFGVDLFTELSKHLTLDELKNLCTTDRKYRAICQSERFQKLLREKYEREKSYRDKINEILKSGASGFTYYLDNQGHTISYNNIPNDVSLWEMIRDRNGKRVQNFSQKSVLRKLFGIAPEILDRYRPDYIVRNVTLDEVKLMLNELVHREDFDLDNFSYLE